MKEQVKQALENLMTRDMTWLWLVVSIVGLLISIVIEEPITLMLSATMLFATFDIYGYHYLLVRFGFVNELNIAHFSELRIAYRLIQSTFQLMLYILIASICVINSYSFIVVLSTIIAWWFGYCDYLFYIILKQDDMLKSKDMFWLWWTPYGIVLRIFNKKISGKHLVLFSWIGLVIAILLIITVEYLK